MGRKTTIPRTNENLLVDFLEKPLFEYYSLVHTGEKTGVQVCHSEKKNARILLEDGTEFEGYAIGHEKSAAGELVVFTGQPDIARLLTDPAVRGTIVLLTLPLSGATGVPLNETDEHNLELFQESSQCQAAGLVVSREQQNALHYTAKKSLRRWLKTHQVPGIYGVDTRALVQRVKLRGSMRAKILVGENRDVSFAASQSHNQSAHVSVKRPVSYGSGNKKIILVDCGTRNSLIRSLIAPDTTVLRVPYTYDFSAGDFDGICIAGGPGDPTTCEKTCAVIRKVLARDKPVFATGQGAVILALAAGATPYRMAQGHRSTSVPCISLENGRCYITAQNHGYGIRDDSLPGGWYPTFLNNSDNSLEGFAARKGLVNGVLFNPEGKPGPDDTAFLYEAFLTLVRNGRVSE